jgi:hypothetical protein
MGKSPVSKPTKAEKSMSSREASDREVADRSQRPDIIVYALDDEDSVKAEEDEVDIITPLVYEDESI